MYLETSLEELFKRDRYIVIFGIAGVSVLSWAYMFHLAWGMTVMEMGIKMSSPQMQTWGAVDFVLTFFMWAVMMVAMMVPSAGPTVLMFAALNRSRRRQQGPYVGTGVFLLGYLAAWIWYSALATVLQCGLIRAALLSSHMVSTSSILGGTLLMIAGIFQFTPLKHACLSQCRSPLGFFLNEWREGTRGAFIMGLVNGNYCVICCWALMSLMFVAGVMNLLWMASIAAFVLVEKVAPRGEWIARISGTLLLVWGLWVLAGPLD